MLTKLWLIIFFIHFNYLKSYSENYQSENFSTKIQIFQTNYKVLPAGINFIDIVLPMNSIGMKPDISTIILLLISAFLLAVIFIYIRNKKSSLEIIRMIKDECKSLQDKMAEPSKELMDSINFTKAIQNAFLPPASLFDELFSESFIFFKPKHIVSGDFYFLATKNNKVFIAVADCTGHSIPGAILSILGINYLNDIINKSEEISAEEVLNKLREKLIQNLHLSDDISDTKIGIDIVLCIIDKERMEVQFSGAYSPLYFICNKNLDIFRSDRIPIGYSLKADSYFTRHTFAIHPGDILYLLSDGYCDQFGGESHKKFMGKRFGHLLLDIYQHPLQKQKEWLEKTLNDWKGDNNQVDDITVVGIKI